MQIFSTLWNAVSPYLPTAADIAGIIGLVISCVTLWNTRKIQTALVAHAEQVEFEQKVAEIVRELRSFSESILEDDLYTVQILDKILDRIESLEIYYPSSVVKIKKDLTKLKKELNQAIEQIPTQPTYKKRQVAHSLSVLSKKLDKLAKEAKAQ